MEKPKIETRPKRQEPENESDIWTEVLADPAFKKGAAAVEEALTRIQEERIGEAEVKRIHEEEIAEAETAAIEAKKKQKAA